MANLNFELPVGVRFQNEYHRKVELLKTNGVAEKVFAQKLSDRPWTWLGYVISIGVKSIGSIMVGGACREEYVTTRGITIPPIVLATPIADINTMTVEIHRKVWDNLLKQQENQCNACGKGFKMDIDLSRIKLDAESEALTGKEYDTLIVNLNEGYLFKSPGVEKKMFAELDGLTFNRFTFRVPTLADAIRHEGIADDSIMFWRKVAYDCLNKMEAVDESGQILGEMDVAQKAIVGPKLFDEVLDRKDLADIREALRESLPTLPFFYEEECPCPSKKIVPVAMSANNFFSA